MRHRPLLKLCYVLASLLLGSVAIAQTPNEAPVVPTKKGTSETVKLFDGKSLDGWEGYEEFWSVKDDMIVGKNKDEVKVSTYLLTKKKYSDFHLAFSFKLAESE